MKTRIELELGGKLYRLLPGPGALKRICQEVGDPLQIAVAAELSGMQKRPPPLKTVVDVLYIAMVESDHNVTKDELWELVYEEGVAKQATFVAFATFLMALCHHGELPKDDGSDEDPDEGGEPTEPKPRNRKERRAKKAKARAATGKAAKR